MLSVFYVGGISANSPYFSCIVTDEIWEKGMKVYTKQSLVIKYHRAETIALIDGHRCLQEI